MSGFHHTPYINGSTGAPQRVAPSVNDILGGTFGVVGALAALNDRQRTGRGRHVRAGLFENNLLLVAQFIAQQQLSGQAPVPMGDKRTPPWGVYDIFDTQDGGRVFVAVVSDANWQTPDEPLHSGVAAAGIPKTFHPQTPHA